MDSIYQNIICFAVGIVGAVVVIKLIRRQPKQTESKSGCQNPSDVSKEDSTASSLTVIQRPQGNAKEAFIVNVSNLGPLFDSLNKGIKFNEAINDAIIEINNQELMDIWVKISKDHKAVLRILSMWGIRREDELQFQPQSYHIERYDTIDGKTIESSKTYKVISPCWIYTHYEKNGKIRKSVIVKGKAQEV